MKFKILLLLSIITISLACSFNASASTSALAQATESIQEYKQNYQPEVYKAPPEYMFFVDFGVLLLLLFAGLYAVLKLKSQKAVTILTLITFAYLGFIRGGCVCPVGAISNATMGIVNPENVGLLTIFLFLAPLIVALIAGRIFCSSGCPLGAVQQLSKKKKKYVKLPAKLNLALKIIPVIILFATIYFAYTKQCFFICKLEPYKAIFFTGQSWTEQLWALITSQPMEVRFLFAGTLITWIYLIGILILGFWVPRPFCRFICPYGVLLGIFSVFSFKRRKIKDTCVYCGLCEKVCPTQAIKIDRKTKTSYISNYDCVQCNACNNACKKDSIKMG